MEVFVSTLPVQECTSYQTHTKRLSLWIAGQIANTAVSSLS